jgi:hypothetical protein
MSAIEWCVNFIVVYMYLLICLHLFLFSLVECLLDYLY